MRSYALIAALPLLALTACGGASGPQTAGSVAAPSGGGTAGPGGGIGGGTPTPTPTSTPTPTTTHFLDVDTETTFNVIGAFQSLTVTETGDPSKLGPKLYQGNASTVRSPSGTINYSPRDGIFTVNFSDTKAGVSTGVFRFQDPAHRSDSPYWGVPTGLTDFNFIEARGGSARNANPATNPPDFGRVDQVTFFYQRPGSKTNYVSLAGYVRNQYEPSAAPGVDDTVFKKDSSTVFDRGAMVFGTPTIRSQVPITGNADYSGGLLATMVANTTLDTKPNYFQWITGTADLSLDFSKSTMAMLLRGTTQSVVYAGQTLPDNASTIAGGASFVAKGGGVIDMTASGGFTGLFSTVCFSCTVTNNAGGAFASAADAKIVTTGSTFTVLDQPVNPNNNVAGANSIDGTFFGPNAVNVGGNFRIVGGVPDQRVDIMGAFTGAKK